MSQAPDLSKSTCVYRDIFGASHLDVFFDDSPPSASTWNTFLWHVYRWSALIFVFVFYPTFITLHLIGLFTENGGDVVQLASDISLMAHNLQNILKMSYFIVKRSMFKSLCMDFYRFNTATHRPNLVKKILDEKAESMVRLSRQVYLISYGNIMFWFIFPMTLSFISYVLFATGNAEPLPRWIPKMSRVRFPFNTDQPFNNIVEILLEVILLSIGFVYFQPIDTFFMCTVSMASAQSKILCTSLLGFPVEVRDYLNEPIIEVGKDRQEAMDLKKFVDDHQSLIEYRNKLHRVLSPVVGLAVVVNLTIMCTSTVVAADNAGPLKQNLLPVMANFLIIMTATSSFYMYTWMCHIFKQAEERLFFLLYCTNWYERGNKFRRSIMIIMNRCRQARPMTIFGVGDVDRGMFIEGLKGIYSFYNFLTKFK